MRSGNLCSRYCRWYALGRGQVAAMKIDKKQYNYPLRCDVKNLILIAALYQGVHCPLPMMGGCRRLANDYKWTIESSFAWAKRDACRFMIWRIANTYPIEGMKQFNGWRILSYSLRAGIKINQYSSFNAEICSGAPAMAGTSSLLPFRA